MSPTTSPVKHVYIETFGCQMNELDTERMLGFLSGASYSATDDPSRADVILLNTCSVRDKAEQKVYSAAGRYRALKDENPALIIGISGCVAQQRGESLLKRLPYLDLVLGPANLHRIGELVEKVRAGKVRIADTELSEEIDPDEYPESAVSKDRLKAFVSIMRGCDNFCSYCIVPFTRGREVSRLPEDIVSEISALASSGIAEVTLLGQNVNSYGKKSASLLSFAELLKMVCRVDGIERVRFITSHPKDISPELIELFGSEGKLARHLHLPLQSASNRVLKRMKRIYTKEEYLAKVRRIKELYPDMALTTDIIVGFPGESEDDFNETLELLEEIRYDNIFSFKYSPREGTAAYSFDDQVPDAIQTERLGRLQKMQTLITAEKNEALVGRGVQVLVEGESKLDRTELTGRTSSNRVVNFPFPEKEEVDDLRGSIKDIHITAAYTNSLRGLLDERRVKCS